MPRTSREFATDDLKGVNRVARAWICLSTSLVCGARVWGLWRVFGFYPRDALFETLFEKSLSQPPPPPRKLSNEATSPTPGSFWIVYPCF